MSFGHVILDRDGVLNVEDPDGGYVLSPDAFVWIEGAREAITLLRGHKLALSIATNQRCVAAGLIDETGLQAIHAKVTRESGIDAIFYCPHERDAGCRCRKPGPALLERAIAASGVAAGDTVFIGDSASDLGAAAAAGVAGWLVRTGKGEQTAAALPQPVPTFNDLLAAARAIVSDQGVSSRR